MDFTSISTEIGCNMGESSTSVCTNLVIVNQQLASYLFVLVDLVISENDLFTVSLMINIVLEVIWYI